MLTATGRTVEVMQTYDAEASNSLMENMKAASPPCAKEDPLKNYLLSEDPVMVRVSTFKTGGKNQVRDIWSSRVRGKVNSIKKNGWFSQECAHALADEGVTVSSNRELVLGPGVNEACLDPFDASHRIMAVRTLEHDHPSTYYMIPTMIYSSQTPRELWRRVAFARMEINYYCDPYNTIDLLRLTDITVTEQTLNVSTTFFARATKIYDALYGQPSTSVITLHNAK